MSLQPAGYESPCPSSLSGEPRVAELQRRLFVASDWRRWLAARSMDTQEATHAYRAAWAEYDQACRECAINRGRRGR
jgi:hypothetical protein